MIQNKRKIRLNREGVTIKDRDWPVWSKRLSDLNYRLIQKYIESVKFGQGRFGIDEANFNKLILYRKGFCQRLKWLIQNYPFEYKSLSVKCFLFWNGHKFYSKRKLRKLKVIYKITVSMHNLKYSCQIIQADWQFLKLSKRSVNRIARFEINSTSASNHFWRGWKWLNVVSSVKSFQMTHLPLTAHFDLK